MGKIGFVLLLLAATMARGASFDCAKAATPQEKAICASPQLSAADDSMAAAYKAVLAKVGTDVAAKIRQSQRLWIKEMAFNCPLREAYNPRQAVHFNSQFTQCLLFFEKRRAEQLEQMVQHQQGVTFIWRSVSFGAPGDADGNSQEQNGGDYGTLQASWPQADSTTQEWQAWNKAIASAAYGLGSANAGGNSGRWDESMTDGMDTDVSVKLNWVGRNLVASTVSNVWYGHGAAHPNLNFIQFNWLLKEQRQLNQTDLFVTTSKWKEKLATTCDAAARAQLGDMYADNPPPGVIPNAMKAIVENPKSWQLDADGLTIAFEPYAVGCHACTPSPVTIPWPDLRPYLNPKFEIPR